jgi:hypothetical protein
LWSVPAEEADVAELAGPGQQRAITSKELSIDEQRCSTHAFTNVGSDVGNARELSRAVKVRVPVGRRVHVH